MYELVQVGTHTYYIQSPAKIGLVVLKENSVCLIDSGNLLTEPVSGDPVAFVAPSAAARLPPDVVEYLLCGSGDPPPSIAPRIRIIPAKSLTGEGLFRAIRPDVLFVNGTKRSAYISLREAGKGSFAAYDGVIPPSLT